MATRQRHRSRQPRAGHRLYLLLLQGVLALLALGCRRTVAPQILLLPPTTGVPLFDGMHAGAVSGARTCGLHVHYDGPPREDDLLGQISFFEKFRKNHGGGIILVPTQSQALRNPVQRAVSEGVPVVVVGSDLGLHSPNLAYVLNDERFGSQLAAERLNELLHGHGTIAIMGVDLNMARSLNRESLLEAELARRYPNIHVSERLGGSVNIAQEEQTAQHLLNGSLPIDAIVALSADSTRGAYYALMNRSPARHVVLLGFDQDMLPPLRDGEIDGLIAQRAREMGQLAAQTICDRLEGKVSNQRILVQPFLITPANISSPFVQAELDRTWWDPRQE